MRILLDTHSFLWFVAGSVDLPRRARNAISDEASEAIVSAASGWEIATKYRLGKLPDYAAVASNVDRTVLERGFQPLSVTMAHAQHAGALPGPHKDPFDRLLAAQALLEGLVLISNDKAFDAFGVRRVW